MLRRLFALVVVSALVGAAYHTVEHGAEAARWPLPAAAIDAALKPVVLVVLGMGPAPGDPLLDRVELAAELFRTHRVERLIASGGKGADETEPEADTIARELMARGVPAAAIRKEAASGSTRENLANSGRMLAGADAAGTLVVVTHAYHAARAGAVARSQGLRNVAGHDLDVIVAATDGTRLDQREVRLAREVLSTLKWWVQSLLL